MTTTNHSDAEYSDQFDPSNWDHHVDNETLNASDKIQGSWSRVLYAVGALLSLLVMGGVALVIFYQVARIIWP